MVRNRHIRKYILPVEGTLKHLSYRTDSSILNNKAVHHFRCTALLQSLTKYN